MAEGILRHFGGDSVEVYSAGSEPGGVHPGAVRAMADMNINISQHTSKEMDDFVGQQFDYVITVCDKVREVCPVFPDDPERIHWSFADPAAVKGPAEVGYQAFKQTARELQTRISYLLMVIERGQEGRKNPVGPVMSLPAQRH
jgi:protein-tyrosine-phosphatase